MKGIKSSYTKRRWWLGMFDNMLATISFIILTISIGLQADHVSAQSIPADGSVVNRGLDKYNFFYAGERMDQRMYVVKDGKVSWSYYDAEGRGEISDAILLSDGHILIAHQYGIREIVPDFKTSDRYTTLWKMDVPNGYEIHSIQPIGKDKVVYVQCGDPLQAVVMEIPSLRELKRINLPYNDGFSHGQMRNFRLTPQGTMLMASFQYNAIIEFDSEGNELRRIQMPGVWGVEILKNGHILGSSTKGYAREVDKDGNTVWEYDWAKNPAYNGINCQKAHRLKNGNTIINTWFNGWGGKQPDRKNPPVQAIEVTPEGRIVWELCSWNEPADLGPATTIQLLNEPVKRKKLHFGDFK